MYFTVEVPGARVRVRARRPAARRAPVVAARWRAAATARAGSQRRTWRDRGNMDGSDCEYSEIPYMYRLYPACCDKSGCWCECVRYCSIGSDLGHILYNITKDYIKAKSNETAKCDHPLSFAKY